MTGPGVYSRAIEQVYQESFGHSLEHSKVNTQTDQTLKQKDFPFGSMVLTMESFFALNTANHTCLTKQRSIGVEQKERELLKN